MLHEMVSFNETRLVKRLDKLVGIAVRDLLNGLLDAEVN